jgi:hypothetical protein
MSMLAVVIAATVAAAAPADRDNPPEAPATLAFDSGIEALAGITYGLEAVDEQELAFGQKLATSVPTGTRTVRYSCPANGEGDGNGTLSFEFEAGQKYQLVCLPDAHAEIRAGDC